jgi:hypothetical protein
LKRTSFRIRKGHSQQPEWTPILRNGVECFRFMGHDFSSRVLALEPGKE